MGFHLSKRLISNEKSKSKKLPEMGIVQNISEFSIHDVVTHVNIRANCGHVESIYGATVRTN